MVLIHLSPRNECSLGELAETIARLTGFTGQLLWDNIKPDVRPRKLMDASRPAALGWGSGIGLEQGSRKIF
jgi:GDP-L-fucose synthase